MQKRKMQKIYVILFLCLGICFFGRGIVDAQTTITCSSNVELCGSRATSIQATNDRCNVRYQTASGDWYYNNIGEAFNVCTSNINVANCFVAKIQGSIDTEKIKSTTAENAKKYYNYKLLVLDAIKSKLGLTIQKQDYGTRGVVNTTIPRPIGELQNILLGYQPGGGTNAADCKIGIGTLTKFINTDFCSQYDSKFIDKVMNPTNTLVCISNYYDVIDDEAVKNGSPDGGSLCCTSDKPKCNDIQEAKTDGYIIDGPCNANQETKKYLDDTVTCCKEKEVEKICIIGELCKSVDIIAQKEYSIGNNQIPVEVVFSCTDTNGSVISINPTLEDCNKITIQGRAGRSWTTQLNKCVVSLNGDDFDSDILISVNIPEINGIVCKDFQKIETINLTSTTTPTETYSCPDLGDKKLTKDDVSKGKSCVTLDGDKWESYSTPVKLGDDECCRKKCKAGETRMTNGKADPNGKCQCDPNLPDPKDASRKQCCGIKLNTIVPFIGDCIEMSNTNVVDTSDPNTTTVNQVTAFPVLMGGLTKILVTVILIMSFLMVIVGGAMMTFGETKIGNEGGYSAGVKILGRVVAALAMLGVSGIILRLINPTFFG